MKKRNVSCTCSTSCKCNDSILLTSVKETLLSGYQNNEIREYAVAMAEPPGVRFTSKKRNKTLVAGIGK